METQFDIEDSFIIKLVSGETIISIIADADENNLTLAFPYRVKYKKTKQDRIKVEFMQWLFGVAEQIFILSSQDIMVMSPADESINKLYNRCLIENSVKLSPSTPIINDLFGRN